MSGESELDSTTINLQSKIISVATEVFILESRTTGSGVSVTFRAHRTPYGDGLATLYAGIGAEYKNAQRRKDF
jgi:hypothetical protein